MFRHNSPPTSRAAPCAWRRFFGPGAGLPHDGGRAQVSPKESAKPVKPADGLDAKLWAAEPMVHNPTNMDVDSRGRVWITEGLNYRLNKAEKQPAPQGRRGRPDQDPRRYRR